MFIWLSVYYSSNKILIYKPKKVLKINVWEPLDTIPYSTEIQIPFRSLIRLLNLLLMPPFFFFFIFKFLAALGLRCCVRAFSSCGAPVVGARAQ